MAVPMTTRQFLMAQADLFAAAESILPGGPIVSRGLFGFAQSVPDQPLPTSPAVGAPGAAAAGGFPGLPFPDLSALLTPAGGARPAVPTNGGRRTMLGTPTRVVPILRSGLS